MGIDIYIIYYIIITGDIMRIHFVAFATQGEAEEYIRKFVGEEFMAKIIKTDDGWVAQITRKG